MAIQGHTNSYLVGCGRAFIYYHPSSQTTTQEIWDTGGCREDDALDRLSKIADIRNQVDAEFYAMVDNLGDLHDDRVNLILVRHLLEINALEKKLHKLTQPKKR